MDGMCIGGCNGIGDLLDEIVLFRRQLSAGEVLWHSQARSGIEVPIGLSTIPPSGMAGLLVTTQSASTAMCQGG